MKRFVHTILLFSAVSLGHAEFAPFDMAFAPDGKTIVLTEREGKSIQMIDTETGCVRESVELDFEPTGIAWGEHIIVSDYSGGNLVGFDPETCRKEFAISVSAKPLGAALAPKHDLAVVASYGMCQVDILDLAKLKVISTIPAGRQPFFATVSPDETFALVGNLLPTGPSNSSDVASSVTRIDLGPGHSAENIPLPYGSTNTRQIRISPDNLWAYVAHTRGHVNLPTNQLEKGWVNTNAISIIDLNTNHLYATVLLDNVQRGAADPWGIALSGDGKKLWVSLAGVHELGIINLEALHAYLSGAAFPDQLKPSDAKAKVAFDVWKLIESDPSQRTILQNELSALYAAGVYRRISLPIRGPRAISVSPDGQILAVAGYFSGDVLLISSSDHRIIKRIQLGAKAPASIVHRGEAVFHDARRSFQGWLSCATCHPDGRADGLNWDLLNDGIGNPKNTRSLLFSHETPPSMSTGVRARSKEAVKAGFLHIQFSEANDSELEAVNTYLRSLVPEQSPYLKGGTLSARARAGKEIFNSQETGCGSCHSDRYFTDLRSYDVGTHSRLDYRSEFDNPTLLEIWRSGPYLHSGAAANLRAVILDQNPDGRHGKTSHLTEKEIDALIEYLLSL